MLTDMTKCVWKEEIISPTLEQHENCRQRLSLEDVHDKGEGIRKFKCHVDAYNQCRINPENNSTVSAL